MGTYSYPIPKPSDLGPKFGVPKNKPKNLLPPKVTKPKPTPYPLKTSYRFDPSLTTITKNSKSLMKLYNEAKVKPVVKVDSKGVYVGIGGEFKF
jgi:hypothetical protein